MFTSAKLEKAKKFVIVIRSEIKSLVMQGLLLDIKYEVRGVKKPNHYDICIHFDSKGFTLEETQQCYKKLAAAFNKYSGKSIRESEVGGCEHISIKIKNSLKGENEFALQRLMDEIKSNKEIETPKQTSILPEKDDMGASSDFLDEFADEDGYCDWR